MTLLLLFQFGKERVSPVCVDVSDIVAVKQKLKDVGHVDILVNNAGTNVLQNILDVTPEAYDQ